MSTDRYPFKAVESKWQKAWDQSGCFKVTEKSDKPKYYVLEMLPYPSGRIHVGHVRNYTLGDATARFRRAKGYNVLYPMGWDAFGLPAENAARDRGQHPHKWTHENIASMKEQLKSMGLSYDWSREVTTCDVDYYKHEQKMFIDFYKKGIAYRKEAMVNWDPVDHTVLANEQVIDGKGWRSGASVEQKKLTQWFLKITDYAEDLLEAIGGLERWPEKVRLMQENWIGQSVGATVTFDLSDGGSLDVFSTRPDTLFGASFCAVAATHPLAEKFLTDAKVAAFIDECKNDARTQETLDKAEKKGLLLPVSAIHPFTKKEIPIYIANFILMGYGTGAIFGCPAHDERDLMFARKYKLDVVPVVLPEGENEKTFTIGDEPYLEDGAHINSDFLNGLNTADAKTKAIDKLVALRKGKETITYRLRDWGVSRQRYWGCPIPMIHCESCGVVPVPDKDLPVKLPEDVTFDKPGNPIEQHPTFKHVDCPSCGKKARRDTDTLDTFFESSWYFARYCSLPQDKAFEKSAVDYWLPVDQYIGGIEHAVLHLLYARFFTRALSDCGYLSVKEPFAGLMTQGMINHETYQDIDGKWLYPTEIERRDGKVVRSSDGSAVKVGPIIKMSKSKHNTVDPDDIIQSYGADAIRLFILSDSPPDRDLDWTTAGLEGAWRYLNRVWRLVNGSAQMVNGAGAKTSSYGARATNLRQMVHKTIDAVTKNFMSFQFNSSVARIRELSNAIEDFVTTEVSAGDEKAALIEAIDAFVRLIAPIAPHFAEEAWQVLGHKESLVQTPWPEADGTLLVDASVTIAVQVNGKLRGTIEMPKDSDKKVVEAAALEMENVKKHLNGNEPKKIIVVPNKIVNIVG